MNLRVTLSNIDYLRFFKDYNIEGVIVGLDRFSDRFNSYFTIDQLKEIIVLSKLNNLNVYVNLNVMIEEDEIDDLRHYLKELYKLELTGIYFNDFALLNIAYDLGMAHKMIYSADTLITNSLDALFYLKQGIKSVVVAKEITLNELIKMGQRCDNLELIIHGRINLSYSKRMFLTNYMNYINSDYPVKDNYHLTIKEETRDTRMPIIETKYGTSIYSDMSLCSFIEYDSLKALFSVGIIDDIFMSKDELLDTLGAYFELNQANAIMIDKKFKDKYPRVNYGSCFYYDKTTKTKEGE